MTFHLPVRHLLKVVSPAVTWKEVRRSCAWQVPTARLSHNPMAGRHTLRRSQRQLSRRRRKMTQTVEEKNKGACPRGVRNIVQQEGPCSARSGFGPLVTSNIAPTFRPVVTACSNTRGRGRPRAAWSYGTPVRLQRSRGRRLLVRSRRAPPPHRRKYSIMDVRERARLDEYRLTACHPNRVQASRRRRRGRALRAWDRINRSIRCRPHDQPIEDGHDGEHQSQNNATRSPTCVSDGSYRQREGSSTVATRRLDRASTLLTVMACQRPARCGHTCCSSRPIGSYLLVS